MLTRWNPFNPSGLARPATQMPVFDDFFREADRLFDGAFNSLGTLNAFPPADVYETQDEVCLRMDLPGYDPNDIHIQVEGDLLTVTARRSEPEQKWAWARRERVQGEVARSFVLPSTVDAAKCEAGFQHGVLTLTLPKREEAKPRTITVKVNG